MIDDKYSNVSNLIQSLELVQNVSNPNMMKVAGEDITSYNRYDLTEISGVSGKVSHALK